MQMNLKKDEKNEMKFGESFIISIPRELRQALQYSNEKDVEIEEFCDDVIKKSFNFFNEVLDIVLNEQIKLKKS